MLAAIRRAEDAALLLTGRQSPGRTREDDVWIRWMHDNAADATCFVEAHVRPRLARVHRLVDAVADHVAVADRPGLARPGPDDARVGWRDGERADGRDRHAVADRRPADAAVRRFPDAARGSARVVDRRVAGNTRDGGDAIADRRPEESERERLGRRPPAAAALCADQYRTRDRQRRSGSDRDAEPCGLHDPHCRLVSW